MLMWGCLLLDAHTLRIFAMWGSEVLTLTICNFLGVHQFGFEHKCVNGSYVMQLSKTTSISARNVDEMRVKNEEYDDIMNIG